MQKQTCTLRHAYTNAQVITASLLPPYILHIVEFSVVFRIKKIAEICPKWSSNYLKERFTFSSSLHSEGLSKSQFSKVVRARIIIWFTLEPLVPLVHKEVNSNYGVLPGLSRWSWLRLSGKLIIDTVVIWYCYSFSHQTEPLHWNLVLLIYLFIGNVQIVTPTLEAFEWISIYKYALA